jgi:serine phosphatase RsbU (regulator of sigma subunit)
VIHSNAHDKRRQKRIDRQLKTERETLEKQIKAATKNDYYCEADAKKAAQELQNLKMKYHHAEIEIEQIPKYKRGRPKDGVREIKEMHYGFTCKIVEKEKAVSKLKEEAGCFVMITNVSEDGKNGYDSRAILKTYKEQYGI